MDYAAQIEALLNKNLVLKQESRALIRERLPSLKEPDLQQLIQVLTQLNQEQDAGLVKMLEKNPNFFKDLERLIITTMHLEFEKREAPVRAAAEAELEQNLQALPDTPQPVTA